MENYERDRSGLSQLYTEMSRQQTRELEKTAMDRVVGYLNPHVRGAFLVGTASSDLSSDTRWNTYQLSMHDGDCMMLMSVLPEVVCSWSRRVLLAQPTRDIMYISQARGEPMDTEGLRRAMYSSLTEFNQFFTRWVLVGHFLTEFNCLEPMIFAHKPAEDGLAPFMRSVIHALNYMCYQYLESNHLALLTPLMELVRDNVEDFIDLYPDPEFENSQSSLQRLLVEGMPLFPERLFRATELGQNNQDDSEEPIG